MNILIGRDAGRTRMASTSALLSDKTLQGRCRQSEEGQVSCSQACHRSESRGISVSGRRATISKNRCRKLQAYNSEMDTVTGRRPVSVLPTTYPECMEAAFS